MNDIFYPGGQPYTPPRELDEEKAIDFSAFNNPPWLKKSGWSLNFTEPEVIYEL